MITREPSIINEILSPQGQLVQAARTSVRLAQMDHLIMSDDMEEGLSNSRQAIKDRYDLEKRAQEQVLVNYSNCSNSTNPSTTTVPPSETPTQQEDEVIAQAPDTDHNLGDTITDNRQEHVHNGVPPDVLTQLIKDLAAPKVDTATEAILEKLQESSTKQDASNSQIADLLRQLVNKPNPDIVFPPQPQPAPVHVTQTAPAPVVQPAQPTEPSRIERIKKVASWVPAAAALGTALGGTALGAAIVAAMNSNKERVVEKPTTKQVQVEDPKVRVRFFYDDPDKGLIPIKSGVRGNLDIDGEPKADRK